MIYKLLTMTHVVWDYLNQSVTPEPNQKSVWGFKKFFYLYQINLLETCWSQDSLTPHHEIIDQDEYPTGN